MEPQTDRREYFKAWQYARRAPSPKVDMGPCGLSVEEEKAMDGGCSCHGYECNCEAHHASNLRILVRRLLSSTPPDPSSAAKEAVLTDEDVEWVVNDIAELGVKIRGQFFFLYKGQSYQGGAMWRPVFKREFGEVCHPWQNIEYHEKKKRGHLFRPEDVRLPDNFIGYFGEDESDWAILPKHSVPCDYEEPCPACARLAALDQEKPK